MTDFNFDVSKRFIDNCVGFLEDVKDIDPEMASILEQNWDKLLAVVIEGERDTKVRIAFNEAIVTVLDGLIAPKAEEEGE